MDIETIRDVVGLWAADEPLVEAVDLYGSYAKGCATDASDIDLAVTFRATSSRTPLGVYIENGRKMGLDLGALLGKEVQVEPLSEKAAIVWAAVHKYGVRLWPPTA